MGSPHPRQIDEIDGADLLTIKIAILEATDEDDIADVTYTFGLTLIDEAYIDFDPDCGNASSDVGVYAIETGLVDIEKSSTEVVIRTTNNSSILTNEVETANGKSRVTGDFAIHGVPGTASKVAVNFTNPGGEESGDLLPRSSPTIEKTGVVR
jgi:2-methylaconitate cis-trans-isomerase PrpF